MAVIKNPIIQTTCAANNRKDLTGKRFGRLVAVKYVGSELVQTIPKHKYKSVLEVKCDCGTTTLVRGSDLGAKTKSCGCHKREATIAHNIAHKTKSSYCTFSAVWQSYKNGAKDRDLKFELDKQTFLYLTTANCHYCGLEPRQIRKSRTKGTDPSYVYNGIDRIDSDLGYVEGNVLSCCKQCNIAKGTHTYKKFFEWISKIVKFQFNVDIPNKE